MVKAKIPNLDVAASDYADNASRKAGTWHENIKKADVAGALKTKGAKNFEAKKDVMVSAYKTAVQKVDNTLIFAGVDARGETNYRSGVSAGKDKWKRGMNETVVAALNEVDLPERTPEPLSANNIKRAEELWKKFNEKARARRGLK